MNFPSRIAAGLAGITVLVSVLACVVTPTMDGSTDAPGTCVAGSTVACSCTDGRSGAQTCNAAGSAYGACVCTGDGGGSCTVAAGNPCTTPDECCPISGTPTACAALPGEGRICSARCNSGADCATGCCAQLADGTRACNAARWCAQPGACVVQVGSTCTSDEQCCPDTVSGWAAACSSGSSGVQWCSTLCVDNGSCSSSCCRARPTDGLKTCRPTAECQ